MGLISRVSSRTYRFTYFKMLENCPDWLVGDIKHMTVRQLLYQVLNMGMVISSALMIWKSLMLISGSESPIVVVLSGSMEPAFYRGDLLVLTHYRSTPVEIGEIVVYRLKEREIPIVHRVISRHENTETGETKYLTKGDNNQVDDRGLYDKGQVWLSKDDIIGRARGQAPYVGMITILLNNNPRLKYILLGVLGVFMLIRKEDQ